MIEAVVAASMAGLLASAHCAAMCGPIAVAGSCAGGRIDRGEALGYFAARGTAYSTVGALLGAGGQRLLAVLPVGALQTFASLAIAAVAAAKAATLLRDRDGAGLIAASRLSRRRESPSVASTFVSTVVAFVPRRGVALGAATAVLPCGALVPAWLLAAGTARPEAGAAAMAAFAIASAPGLVIAMVGAGFARMVLSRVPARAQAAGWLVLAAWMIARPVLGTACCALRL